MKKLLLFFFLLFSISSIAQNLSNQELNTLEVQLMPFQVRLRNAPYTIQTTAKNKPVTTEVLSQYIQQKLNLKIDSIYATKSSPIFNGNVNFGGSINAGNTLDNAVFNLNNYFSGGMLNTFSIAGTLNNTRLGNLTNFPLSLYTNNTERLTVLGNGNVGVGTASPTSKLQVSNGDFELDTIGNGVIIKSPNGTRFRLTISNNGDIIATSL